MTIQRPIRAILSGMLVTLIGALLILMTAQIVFRYGFNSSLLWAEEMCRYMLIWLAFLGMAMSYERGEVAALTFVSGALGRGPALVLAIFCSLLSFAFCALLVWYGLKFAGLAGGSQIPAMRFILEDLFGANAPEAPGIYWVYVALPVGMALLALRLAADVVLFIRALATGETLTEVLGRTQTGVVE